jgi:predicted nuclease of predicted toxin-antitoxin system
MEDNDVLLKAFAENWILITNDKDFGEKAFREKQPHHGVILLRLRDERNVNKIAILQRLLDNYAARLADSFVVATEKGVRFARS